MKPRAHPPARPHGKIREVFADLFFVSGTMRMPGPVPVTFSRAMTLVRDAGRVAIVNSMRLDDEGLRSIDALGKVTDVIRLAGNHGSDDAFYKERYNAKVWAVRGSKYMPGFDAKAVAYFEPDEWFDAASTLPLPNARVHIFGSKPPEGLVVLERDGGIALAGDSLQNWESVDSYFNFPGSVMMRMMGFIKPCNVGPGWLSQCKPPADDLRAVLDLTFEHVLPSHGEPVIGGARDKFRAAIESAAARMK